LDTDFSGKTTLKQDVQQQSGRWAERAGARDLRKDGRHPKYKNHGRIAGC